MGAASTLQRLSLTLATLLLAVTWGVAPAQAQAPAATPAQTTPASTTPASTAPAPSTAAADQYVESVPPPQAPARKHVTAPRARPVTHHASSAPAAPVVPHAPATTPAAPVAPVAAPATPARHRVVHRARKHHHRRHHAAHANPQAQPASPIMPAHAPAVSAAPAPAVASGDRALLWLLMAMLAITGVILGTVRYQRTRAGV